MRHRSILAGTVVLCLLCSLGLEAQQSDSSVSNNTNLPASSQSAAGTVPRLIKFTGEINPQITQITRITGSEGGKNPLPTVVGVTFSLYELQEGGSPLWSESQKVQVDEQGHYTVLLGATQPEGLPLDFHFRHTLGVAEIPEKSHNVLLSDLCALRGELLFSLHSRYLIASTSGLPCVPEGCVSPSAAARVAARSMGWQWLK